jgi:hypothetical protein
MSLELIAVAWSGARLGAQRKIALAQVADGQLVRLEGGRDRVEVGDYLIAEGIRDPRRVIGLDVAFSLPIWFLDERQLVTAPDLWALAECEAET